MEGLVREQLKEFLVYTRALLDSMDANRLSDPENLWKYAGYKTFIRKYNQLVASVKQLVAVDPVVDVFDIEKIPGSGDTVPLQQKEFFEMAYTCLSILKAFLENKLDLKTDEISNLKNFLLVNLRRAVFETPEKELAIQDVVEQLLIGRSLSKGLDYDRETGRVKISIKETVPDFIFPRLGLALEIKLSKDKAKSKALVDEINADIMAYRKNYSYLLFLVYDLGSIRDELEFKKDLESTEKVELIIVKQ
jgi:hypothetical protein